jgi:hypothetical protein
MNHPFTVGFLLAALAVALDGSITLRAIDRSVQSESCTGIHVMTVANAPIRL